MYAINCRLTNREREVLYLVASGHTDRKIAASLIISPRTVNRHMSNILPNWTSRAALPLTPSVED